MSQTLKEAWDKFLDGYRKAANDPEHPDLWEHLMNTLRLIFHPKLLPWWFILFFFVFTATLLLNIERLAE